MIAEDAQHCQDVWMTGADTFTLRRITNTNRQFDAVELGVSQLMSWRSLNGQELRGALLLPVGYKQGKRYPVIVYVYGGLRLSTQVNEWMTSIVINPQLFATRGYAVLFPDTPLRVGTPMQDLASTVLPATLKLVDLGIADSERIGIMGHSYGGYSTLALVEQSRQFHAAVDIAGTTNLMNAYAKTGAGGSTIGWVEEGQGDMGGSLWHYRDRFIENSPLFYLDRIETPILLMHGASDTAVPPIESHIAFESLRRLGKEATYVEYAGEEHVPSQWSYANQVDYCKRILAWFEKYLKGNSVNPSAISSPSSDSQ
jgi:dipeptidyl aminopeptidase/acylaminoacyl peptidase